MRRALPLVLLAACAPVAEETPTPVAFAGGTAWRCDDGQSIRTQQNGDRLGLVLGDGTPLDLPAVQTPAGLRYAADGWVWFRRGDGAILTQQGGQTNCRLSAAPLAAAPVGPAPAVPTVTVAPAFPPNVAPVVPSGPIVATDAPGVAPDRNGVFLSPDLDL